MRSACGPLTKNKERIKKIKETGDSRYIYIYIYIYQNELHKACFQHDMTNWDSKDLNRRKAADKVLCNKALNIAKNFDKCQRIFASMV